MKKKEKDFYEAVNAYNIPVLTLDHNWHKLFGNEEATPDVKVLQEELNELDADTIPELPHITLPLDLDIRLSAGDIKCLEPFVTFEGADNA